MRIKLILTHDGLTTTTTKYFNTMTEALKFLMIVFNAKNAKELERAKIAKGITITLSIINE